MRQLSLHADYAGFLFAPSNLMKDYIDDRAEHPDPGLFGPLNLGETSWVPGRSRDISAALYRHMTNFVAMHRGWHTGGDLIPSAHLQVEISKDQVDLLNPTPRDVQMAAIIDQCCGKKATKVIAKRRIEFIEGNVNSYARILNGPQQLERIKTFNDLASSIATLHKEKDAADEKAKEEKKKQDTEKSKKKADKEEKARVEHVELAPGCKADVEKGLAHVLTLKNDRRKQILKIHFGHSSGLSKILVKDTEAELRKYMGSAIVQSETVVRTDAVGEDNEAIGTDAMGEDNANAVEEMIASVENTVADTVVEAAV